MEEKVTIFVPVKNAESTIKQCIDSLLRQSYRKKEIWVIDNMSTDKTYSILKSYGKKIKLNRMSGPVPKMHNHVLKNVKTRFLTYTNSDCVVDKNWLKNLLKGFTSKDIVATAGYCATPRGLNKLQTLIGKELETRWKEFPKFLLRAPDMNLCVRTDIARRVGYDERFIWAWETDFGYRLTKRGKMKYVPSAIVYHYHRPTWKGFFKQQMNNAKIQFLLQSKHWRNIRSDHISTSGMMLMLVISYLLIGSVMLSLVNTAFLYSSLAMLIFLILFVIKDAMKVTGETFDVPYVLAIFLVRLVAWVVGIPYGVYLYLKEGWCGHQSKTSGGLLFTIKKTKE